MPAISPRIKRATGYAFIASVWAALLGVLVIFAIAWAIHADLKSPARSQLTAGTRWEGLGGLLYYTRFMPIWQQAPRVQFDPELIYVPAPGRFRFHGPEFDTWVTMTAEGVRQQPNSAEPPGGGELVVVTGDSYAMGWGVNDAETFSAVLQDRFHHHTVNAAVSSYGTARELLRLRQLGLLSRASVLVIQYCANDVSENSAFLRGGLNRSQRPNRSWEELQAREQVDITYARVLAGTGGFFRDRIRQKMDAWFGRSAPATGAATPFPPVKREGVSAPQRAASPADDFLAVLARFPELNGKPIVVVELNALGEPAALAGLARREALPPNLHLLPLRLEDADYFRFDSHLTARGHRAVAGQLDRALRAVRENPAAARP